jgi:hypothetical protein
MDIGDRSAASSGGPSSTVRGSGEFSSPARNMATASGLSKTLFVSVESLKVEEFDDVELDSKCPLSPRLLSGTGKHSGKGKFAAKNHRRRSDEVYECDFEEDLIDGFAIASFNTLEDMEVGLFRISLL